MIFDSAHIGFDYKKNQLLLACAGGREYPGLH